MAHAVPFTVPALGGKKITSSAQGYAQHVNIANTIIEHQLLPSTLMSTEEIEPFLVTLTQFLKHLAR